MFILIFINCIEIVASLPQVDEEQLASYGASQGGALALVAAGLNPRIKRTVAIYPFLSDFRRVLEMGIPVKPMMNSSVILSFMIHSMKQKNRSWRRLVILM